MPLGTLLPIILVILLIGALPQVSQHPAGYWPSGGVGVVLIVVLILVLLGRI